MIQEEIAKDPTSSIALAYTLAIRSGRAPGRVGGLLHAVALLPAAAMAAMDARRRPLTATVAYAAALFGVLAWVLSHRPALASMAPGAPETALALALTLIAAVSGGAVARALSDLLLRAAGTR